MSTELLDCFQTLSLNGERGKTKQTRSKTEHIRHTFCFLYLFRYKTEPVHFCMKLLAFSQIYTMYWCTKGKTKINKRCTSTRLQSSNNYLWCPISLTNAYGCTHLITINTYITGDTFVKKRRTTN